MRRLIGRGAGRLRREEGAVAVVVSVIMVALLACAAIALDTAALYSERAQLQNGADAAALAIAQDCADGACPGAAALASQLANLNSNDGSSTALAPTFPDANTVRVVTKTRDGSSGAGALALTFAPVIGIDSRAVTAEARARWGSPKGGPAALALAFAPCVFKLDGPIQVLSMHGDSGGTSCSSVSPSGRVLPGGFGWLKDTTGTCTTRVDVSDPAPVSSDTGVSLPPGCETVLAGLAGKTVLLPVYSDLGGTGSSGWYEIKGWAAFRVLGWNFPSSRHDNNTYSGAKCTGTCKGLIGTFISFVSLDDRFSLGGAPLGSSIISLSK